MMTETLEDVFRRHATDKVIHGYQRLYEPLLAADRETVRRVLEVGIGTMVPGARSTMLGCEPAGYRPGASLRAWRDYFPNAEIWGLDPQPDTMITGEDRITTQLCDSTDPVQVDVALEPQWSFELIVDDGDHRWEAQIATLRNLWPRVAPGGLYVIEDVENPNFRQIADAVGPRGWRGKTLIESASAIEFIAIAIRRQPTQWQGSAGWQAP